MHHIAIATNRIHIMVDFYNRLPGLVEIRKNFREDNSIRSVWFQISNSNTILMLEDEHFCKAPHALVFCMEITGSDKANLNNLILNQIGIPADGETEHTIYFRDPDGNRLGYSDYVE